MPDGWRALAWGDWSTAEFSRALERRCPVALLVETAWSPHCARFRHDLEGDPGARHLVADRYVAIRVDADDRPDIADRYTAHGWPTLVALTPHGWPLAPLDTTSAVASAAGLAAIAATFDARADELLRRTLAPQAPPEFPVPVPTEATDAWLDAWESQGCPADIPPRALVVALECGARSGRDDLVDRAIALVDRLAASALRDETSGLWFRAAPGDPAGWEPVQLLDDQAAWIELEAAVLAARPSEHRTSRLTRTIKGLERSFGTAQGYRSARFSLAGADRDARAVFADTCEYDVRMFVDAQARTAAALVRAGSTTGVSAWTARAVDRLDDLVAAAYRRDGGVAHVLDPAPRVRGLLADQVAVASSLLDAWGVSGRVAYLDAADELLASTVRKFRDSAGGALRDRVATTAGAGDVGLLGHAHHPADANALAAACLLRLSAARGTEALVGTAHDILDATLALCDAADPAHAALLALVR